MGIRPNKSIGWGITVQGSELRQKAAENIIEHEKMSYVGLFDHIEENNLMEQHKQSKFFTKEKFAELDAEKALFNYVEIISENYDSDVDFDEEIWTVLFYPMVLSPLAFHNGSEKFKDGDSPFTYAEIEKFFPESMETLETVSYNIEVPPFPSEYSVVKKSDFTVLQDGRILNDMKKVLRTPYDRFSETYAKMCGFESVSEVVENYQLAPAEEVISFAQYSNVFKNAKNIFDLKPTVVYSWS